MPRGNPRLAEARAKALLSPRIGKHGKEKATLKVEELRANFQNQVLEKWQLLMDAQLTDSLKNYKARHYTIDQTIGKAKESIALDNNINLKLDL